MTENRQAQVPIDFEDRRTNPGGFAEHASMAFNEVQSGNVAVQERDGVNGVDSAESLLYGPPTPSEILGSEEPEKIPVPRSDSMRLLDRTAVLRERSLRSAKAEDEQLATIRVAVSDWIQAEGILASKPGYAVFNEDVIESKIGRLITFLKTNFKGAVSEIELEATRSFIDSSFAMYDKNNRPSDGKVAVDADGSFAFVVPVRASRDRDDYGEEIDSVIPALRYVPANQRAQFMVGLPPFVIDTYRPGDNGKRGYLVFAPVYNDMMTDIEGVGAARKIAQDNVNEAVDFAYQRFDTELVGLGATLPGVMRFGSKVTNPNVIITTGHGGTTQLIAEVVMDAVDLGHVKPESLKRLGAIGLGSIGGSNAQVLASRLPEARFFIHDKDPSTLRKATIALFQRRVDVMKCASNQEVIDASDIIVLAVTSAINLKNAKGKLLVDDSQPSSIEQETAKELGVIVAWPIGIDSFGLIERNYYDYGRTLVGRASLFGCEAEIAVLDRYSEYMKKKGYSDSRRRHILSGFAVRAAVTPVKAHQIGLLFEQFGIKAAPLQAFGELIPEPAEAA